jgi:hypothetical protein
MRWLGSRENFAAEVRPGVLHDRGLRRGIPRGLQPSTTNHQLIIAYSNHARGERKKCGPATDPERSARTTSNYGTCRITTPARLSSKIWRKPIHKVCEVDALACPRRGSEMRMIALIDDPAVIRRILTHRKGPLTAREALLHLIYYRFLASMPR